MKKFMTYLLAIVLSLNVLTSCNTETNSDDQTDDSENMGDTNQEDDDGEETSQDTFEIVTVRWSDWGEDFLEGFVEETEQEKNINIEWDIVLNSDWQDKKAVIMAGGDLPDAFWGSNCFDDAGVSVNKDYFVPLEDYINEETMPNLTKAFEEDPKMQVICTDLDGHIYGLPKKEPLRPTVSNQLFINQVWLDNLGLDMPTNIDEFYDVLTAFKEEDANGNGDPNDELPYAAGYSDVVTSFILPFGTVDKDGLSAASFRVEGDEPIFNPITEEYKEGIKYMHKAFQDGLVDNEIFTQEGSMQDGKLKNSTGSIVGVSSGWTQDAVFGMNSDEYVPMDALEGPDGESYVFSGQEGYQYERNELLITTKCEAPETLLEWADLYYTEDASIQTLYGSFGIGVEKHDDGTYTVLAPPEGESADTFAWINSFRDFGPKYVSPGFNDKVDFETKESGDGLKLELSDAVKYAAKPEMAFPNVMFTKDELDELSVLGVDIGNYVVTMRTQWITEGGIDDTWDEYMDTLDQMGLERYLEIHQDAYDRYIDIYEDVVE